MKVQIAEDYQKMPPKLEKKISHQIILTGDAGHSKIGLTYSMNQMMQQLFEEVGENGTLLLLGDNIRSINENTSPKKLDTKANLALINLIKKFKGKTYFLPGDLEWLNNDQEGVNQIEKWVQDKVKGKDNFIPDDGCPGPEVEIIGDRIALIAIDSRWFIENWNTTAQHNESCDIRDRERFLLEIENEIKRHYGTHNIVIAMHHPVLSTGRRGGYSSWKDHIFPLTTVDGHIPIPLPLVGSVIELFKKKIPSKQDVLHPVYRVLAKHIERLKRDYPGMIIVSAHEFNMQLHKDKEQHYIVSGSLVERAPATLADDVLFTYGGNGVSMLKIYEDGEIEVEFIAPGEGHEPKVLFRQKINDPLPTLAEQMPNSFPVYEQLQDSITVSILQNRSLLDYSEFTWGELNTDLYFDQIKMPIIDLDTTLGGLIPFRRGGSFQTKSIRLKDNEGRLYQLRSLKKSPDKLIPFPLNKTFVLGYMKKQMTAANPFASFTLAPMEDAIGVLHSNPKLVYLPQQPALKEYNDLGNAVYLFEERPDEDWSSLDSYGNSKNIISHFNMREDLLDNHRSKVDQPLVLRTRLFDMIIGDWDRHGDQWRWATFKDEDGNVLYKPIARDRDQAFAIYGGLAHRILQTTLPNFRSLQSFEKELKDKDVQWLSKQARNFDRLYLNELNWTTWSKQVQHIQTHLTDEVIDEAMTRFPAEIKAIGMDKQVAEKLKNRRDHLLNTAEIYYKILNKNIHIPATHKDNLILVERINDEQTKITIFEYKDDKKEKDLIYERIVSTNITKSIICYGLDGDDDFLVSGNVKKGIKVRLVGGNGTDSFEDQSKVKGILRKTIVHDDKHEKTNLKKSRETADRISRQYKFNHYKFKGFQYNYGFILPTVGYDQDQGFRVNAIYTAKRFGYKKVQDHSLSASYAFGNNGSELRYEGVYSNVFGGAAMIVDAQFYEPKFVFNFYGLGNETPNKFESSDFYRVSQERINFSVGLRRYLNKSKNSFFDIVPNFDRIKIRDLEDVFLSSNLAEVENDVFTKKNYLGVNTRFQFTSVDKVTFPRRGLRFEALFNWNSQLKSNGNQFFKFGGELTFYQNVERLSRVILANKIGFQHLVGEFNFYYATRIGGNNNLRGFSNERFTGRTSFYHNIDLRIRLLRIKIAKVPTAFGITPGFDYGRVWIENDKSNKWHKGYGAHLWISPFEYFVISSGMFFSDEENRFSLRFGFHF